MRHLPCCKVLEHRASPERLRHFSKAAMVTVVQVLPFIQREQTAAVTQPVVSLGIEKSYMLYRYHIMTQCKGEKVHISINLATE